MTNRNENVVIELIDKMYHESCIEKSELKFILDNNSDYTNDYLFLKARLKRDEIYGTRIFLRGLIEISNYCKRNCLYCGIRADNKTADRYRLSEEQIISCCNIGYNLGYRTFVLQGGEDDAFTDERIVSIISKIKHNFPESAVTLSLGEKSKESYKKYFIAGADRYLLRHETIIPSLYQKLHPGVTLQNRIKCLYNLKELGFQVGSGFLIGLPEQSLHDLIEDIFFLKTFEPHMIGIGPFIPHKNTPLSLAAAGSSDLTAILIAVLRLIIPTALIPATTALASIDPKGREKGLNAGANVIMPNLSPIDARKKYTLYDGKLFTNSEAAEYLDSIKISIQNLGLSIDMSRGDHIKWRDER